MMHLAEKVFAVKNDPDQLDVDQEVLERLRQIHPDTVLAKDDGKGPVAWVLLIPTSLDLMNQFLSGKISEKELFYLTQPGEKYEAIYLCSALVLDEYRRKGITKQLSLKAITEIRKKHPLKAAFVWTFSNEGGWVAENIAQSACLPLYKRGK